jgi:signal transduction histidine kinase
MDVPYQHVKNKMQTRKNILQQPERAKHIHAFLHQIKLKSDRLTNYFLLSYFLGGFVLAFFYDTWQVAFCVGGLSLLAYYSTKYILPESNLYQYVLSGVLGIFMAQYIYQMHGLFEMHFVAFIGSAMLITYQNWKLQFPIVVIVVLHHAVFGYLQYMGFEKIYFTQLEYMDIQTFIFHVVLAAVIFFICGLWAYHFKKYSEKHLEFSFEIGRLQQEEAEKKDLVKANMELDKFVYSVSHDLRAPLSSMIGVVEIAEEETEDAIVKENLNYLKGSIGKLDTFISDILDYSRNSRMEVRKEEINFQEILNDITNNLKYMSANEKSKKQVKINLDITERAKFHSDKSRLNVVLNNLISNSIRYQNPKADEPFVNILVDTSDTEANIVIRDNGIGINKEQHEKIFEMFYRISESSVGSGLGLYIVKETVDKLQGRIEVESNPGDGTAFTVHIPNNKLILS